MPEGRRSAQLLVVVGLLALAFNLRPTAVSVGPVLSDIRAGLPMGATTAGVLTTLPVLCFSGFGALGPWCARRLGVHRVMLASLLMAALGIGVRATTHGSLVFIVATVVALAGLATANVVLPSLVKQHFPDRIGLMTSLYTTSLAIGLTAAAALTVPVADATGSWRGGLGIWGVTALVAALPWLLLITHDVQPESATPRAFTFAQTARSRLAWWMALFFGTQSLQAYAAFGWLAQIFRDSGFSARDAGLLLALTTAVSIPVSFLMPRLADRLTNQAPIVCSLSACYVVGYLGLIWEPHGGALVWSLLIGLGTGIFPLILTLIGLRARTSDGTSALSGFTQSIGYLIAAVGPFMMGAVYDVSGSWTLPLVILTILVAPQLGAGLLVSRPRYLEDELG